jgi:ketosteroid isomerase-like protein
MRAYCWLIGVAATVATVGAEQPGTIDSLVQAERAFARMSVVTTMREAFLANFADDGVWFTPGPSNTKDALRKQPVPAAPPDRVLDWEPVTGDVAASGDLGYTTGPYARTSRASAGPSATGWFFSVWTRRRDAVWKVAADFGIEAPAAGPLRPREFRPADVTGIAPRARPDAAAAADELRAAEAAFVEEVRAHGLAAAYTARTTDDVRVYRPGALPVVGRTPAGPAMPAGSSILDWLPSHAQASAAGDLGFTYGAYTVSAADGAAPQRGYYLHVWKRRADGWKLAVEVTNQEPNHSGSDFPPLDPLL